MKKNHVLNSSFTTEFGITMLRVFVGIAIFFKGAYFVLNMPLLENLSASSIPFWNFMTAHYVVFAHLIGGLCLMMGLLTRIAALINIPVILGAIVFVHAPQGIFNSNTALELTVFLLVTLCVLTLTGSRFFAIDNFFNSKLEEDEKVINLHKIKHAA